MSLLLCMALHFLPLVLLFVSLLHSLFPQLSFHICKKLLSSGPTGSLGAKFNSPKILLTGPISTVLHVSQCFISCKLFLHSVPKTPHFLRFLSTLFHVYFLHFFWCVLFIWPLHVALAQSSDLGPSLSVSLLLCWSCLPCGLNVTQYLQLQSFYLWPICLLWFWSQWVRYPAGY